MQGKRVEKRQNKKIRLLISVILVVGIVAGAAAIAMISSALSNSTKVVETKPEEIPVDPREGQVLINDGAEERWIVPIEGVDASLIQEEEIKFINNAAIYTGHDYITKRGIDISEHQGEIDWEAVQASGIDFAFIRIGFRGYTKGGVGEDTLWKDNVENAQKNGVLAGVYFFSQAVSVEEAKEEAEYVLELLGDTQLDLPVILDWEVVVSDDSRTANPECRERLTEYAEIFCKTVRDGGYDAGVYFNRQLGYYNYDFSKLKNEFLWLADPGERPQFYYEYDLWQYSFEGEVDGINTVVDMNLMFIPSSKK